ncbi:DNA-binding domain-containing protein [Paraburkholderia sp. J41]|uniref:HvfC/BufC N-terminal domain-containing protein n=1 Tax=Paraburkholderia sp. J41 TaxID=2805433 RepID=UPI002AC31241|nr:DNA-binding domain-containing protein [Paraburkholderia sp. J41]
MQPDLTAFARGLLDPAMPAPRDVTAPGGNGVVKRYNVYRNNVTVSLIDALAAVYPAVQRITGVEFFRAMARFHVRATPPVSPLLFEYGRDFPAFIEAYEYARELPWLADVARIERAWLDAYHAGDQAPLAAAALASIEPAALPTLRFAVHPSARIVRSRFAAVSIFATHRRDDSTPAPLASNEAEDALVTRIGDDVTVSRLPAGGAALLGALFDGEPFGAAVAAAIGAEPSFDLSANLAGMIAAGAFTAIRTGA